MDLKRWAPVLVVGVLLVALLAQAGTAFAQDALAPTATPTREVPLDDDLDPGDLLDLEDVVEDLSDDLLNDVVLDPLEDIVEAVVELIEDVMRVLRNRIPPT